MDAWWEIDTVYAQCDIFLKDIEAEDYGTVIVRFKNGAIGIIEGSACVYPKNLEETLNVFGEKGTVGRCPDSVYGFGHTPLFKDMIDAINNNRQTLVSGEEGKNGMSIILASYKLRFIGMPVKFPLEHFSTLKMIDVNKK